MPSATTHWVFLRIALVIIGVSTLWSCTKSKGNSNATSINDILLECTGADNAIFVSNAASPVDIQDSLKTEVLVEHLRKSLEIVLKNAAPDNPEGTLAVRRGAPGSSLAVPGCLNIVLRNEVEAMGDAEITAAILPSFTALDEASNDIAKNQRFALVPVQRAQGAYSLWLVANRPAGVSAGITYYLRDIVGVKDILPLPWPNGTIFPKPPLTMVPTAEDGQPTIIVKNAYFTTVNFLYGNNGLNALPGLPKSYEPVSFVSHSAARWDSLFTTFAIGTNGSDSPGHSWGDYFKYLSECYLQLSDAAIVRNSTIDCPNLAAAEYAQLVSCLYYSTPDSSDPPPAYVVPAASDDASCQVDEVNFNGKLPYRISLAEATQYSATNLSWIPINETSLSTYTKWVVTSFLAAHAKRPYEYVVNITANDGDRVSQDSATLSFGTPIDQFFEIAAHILAAMKLEPSLLEDGKFKKLIAFFGYYPADGMPTHPETISNELKEQVLIGLTNGFRTGQRLTFDGYTKAYASPPYDIKNIWTYDYFPGMEDWSNGIMPALMEPVGIVRKRMARTPAFNGVGFEASYTASVGLFLSAMHRLNFHPTEDPEAIMKGDFAQLFGPAWQNVWDVLQTYPSRKNYSLSVPWLRMKFEKMTAAYADPLVSSDENVRSSLNMIRLYLLFEYYAMRILETETENEFNLSYLDNHYDCSIPKPIFSPEDEAKSDKNAACSRVPYAQMRASIEGNVANLYAALDTMLTFISRVHTSPKYHSAFAATTKHQYYCRDYRDRFSWKLDGLEALDDFWDDYLDTLADHEPDNFAEVKAGVRGHLAAVAPHKEALLSARSRLMENWCNGVFPIDATQSTPETRPAKFAEINALPDLTDDDISTLFDQASAAMRAVPRLPIADVDIAKVNIVPADPSAACQVSQAEVRSVTNPNESSYTVLVAADSEVEFSILELEGKLSHLLVYNIESEQIAIDEDVAPALRGSEKPVEVSVKVLRQLAAGQYKMVILRGEGSRFPPEIRGVEPNSAEPSRNGKGVRMFSDVPTNDKLDSSFVFFVPPGFSGNTVYMSVSADGARQVAADSGFVTVAERDANFPACLATETCWPVRDSLLDNKGPITLLPGTGGIMAMPVTPGNYYKLGGGIGSLRLLNLPHLLSLSDSCAVTVDRLDFFPSEE